MKCFFTILNYNWFFILYGFFKNFIQNLILICKDFNKILLFVFLVPFVFYIIRFEFYCGLMFLIYFTLLFFFFYFLKSSCTMQCSELPLNTSYLIRYSFYNILIQIPKSFSFLIVYNFFGYIFNSFNMKKSNRFYDRVLIYNIISFIFLMIVAYLIKLSVLLLVGYSYISLYVSSNLVIKFFNLLQLNYKTKKAFYQIVLLNCFISNSSIIAKVDGMKIIFDGDEITFNMKSVFKDFFNNTKNHDYLLRSCMPSDYQCTHAILVGGHYGIIEQSPYYKGENLTINYTSHPKIKVNDDRNGFIEISTKNREKPNFIGQDKENYFTPPYTLDTNSSSIDEFPLKYMEKANTFKTKATMLKVDCKDDKILINKKNEFYKSEDFPTIREYSKEYKLPATLNIEYREFFEKSNEEYLRSERGAKEYELVKQYIMNGNKSFFDNFHTIHQGYEDN